MKPWLEPTHHGVYSRLLRRLLIGDDLAVAVPADEVPPRLRTGLVPTPTASARTSASAFAGTCASRSPHDGGAGALSAAFYCVADSRYFLGAVGLVNSLRLVGHREPIHLLDCGLDDEQRRLLEPEVTLVGAPEHAPPTLLKTIAPLAHPADVMVLIDTDLIVTRRLEEPIADAAGAGWSRFRNDTERHVPEWGELLDLGPVRTQPYVSFALVAFDRALGTEVLRLLSERQARIDFERTYWRERRITEYPLLYADQDVLNAILASRVEPDRLLALDQALAPLPPFTGLRVVDERALRCAYADGVEPYVVHHWLAKPWLEPTHHGVYSRLLRRLLVGEELAIKVPERLIPLRFRAGLRLRGTHPHQRARAVALPRARAAGRARQERQPLRRPLLRRRLALLPGRGRARQLAAPGRPPRADLSARLRPRRRAAAAAGGGGEHRGRPDRRRAPGAQGDRAGAPSRRDDGAHRRRHDRHPPADRADRAGGGGGRGGGRQRPRPLLPGVGGPARPRPACPAVRTSRPGW